MPSNLERYKKDLASLLAMGERLEFVMEVTCPDSLIQS
jgi:hypothetical protein